MADPDWKVKAALRALDALQPWQPSEALAALRSDP